ncbi:hypothetical protein CB0940_10521 [Cercospora beticola]|uniref:Uncharacterized protein n=2 Tax=Cercospora TaxID=29002 RepID=A0A2G5HV46_CERBT|nr:hypothetical protein CB0940_10521 [Cercospora beticola]XP_044663226.1 uncharacterized protein CKM354_001178900 [Cercospora kikuchii]PIA96163.1 hypothetical protein CB0940_10521 [Cercospora beticola]WPB07241.1 hypothetical protein RHO25_011902 [Cercospora beticola]CAK1367210.1 unnamed protein product [Cercospora beticola]GIZ48739.1 hypothetical protein CKM354_001178900 [Cercospora kikuchii]
MTTVEQAQMFHRDHPDEYGPAPGETAEEHAAHKYFEPIRHWGLGRKQESVLFYCFTIPSWCFCIASAVLGSYRRTEAKSFIACATIWLVLWGTAWLQTATLMVQRASWTRDEANLKDRKQYLYLAVRLQRLMIVTATICLPTFIQAYVRRDSFKDTPYWLVFLLFFIFNTVGCVMNAYNNITWECDRLHYEEGEPPMRYTALAILGIPS